MNTKAKASSYKEIADEASYQVACDREFTEWMYALMTAVRDDLKHSSGANSAALSNLGVYLSESHLADSTRALEKFTDSLQNLGGAV